MTTNEIKIAVAECCGWEGILGSTGYHKNKPSSGAIQSGERHGYWLGGIPDYPHDLNAMHEAEKTLDAHEFEMYKCELQQMCKSFFGEGGYEIMASALQRAEAFLHVKGKWKEPQTEKGEK